MDGKKQSVLSMFSSDGELSFYTSIARQGLFEPEKRIIFKHLRKKSRILDLGCGCGREAIALAEAGHTVTAVDFSGRMIETAKGLSKDVRGVDYIQADIESLKFPEGSFDCIIMLAQLIEHIPGKKRRITLLKRLRKTLSSDGKIIFTCHERNQGIFFLIYWHMRYLWNKLNFRDYELGDTILNKTQEKVCGNGSRMFFHLYTKSEAVADARSAGFSQIDALSDAEIMVDVTSSDRKFHYFLVCKK